MVRKLIGVIASIVLVGVGILAWLGAFRSLTVNESRQGGLIVAGYDYTGPFEGIGSTFERAKQTADSLGLPSDHMVGVYYSNPEEVAEDSLLSFAGVVVGTSEEDLGTLDFAGLRLERVPTGNALWIDFYRPNDLAIVVGALRAYPMLTEAAQSRGLEPGWVYEIYRGDSIRYVFQEFAEAEDPSAL